MCIYIHIHRCGLRQRSCDSAAATAHRRWSKISKCVFGDDELKENIYRLYVRISIHSYLYIYKYTCIYTYIYIYIYATLGEASGGNDSLIIRFVDV